MPWAATWELWKVNSRQSRKEGRGSQYSQTGAEFTSFTPLLSLSLDSVQPNLEAEMGTRAQKEHQEKPSRFNSKDRKWSICDRMWRPVFVFLHSIGYQVLNTHDGGSSLQKPKFWGRRTFPSDWWGCRPERIGPILLLSLPLCPLAGPRHGCRNATKWGNQSPSFLTRRLKRGAQGTRKH